MISMNFAMFLSQISLVIPTAWRFGPFISPGVFVSAFKSPNDSFRYSVVRLMSHSGWDSCLIFLQRYYHLQNQTIPKTDDFFSLPWPQRVDGWCVSAFKSLDSRWKTPHGYAPWAWMENSMPLVVNLHAIGHQSPCYWASNSMLFKRSIRYFDKYLCINYFWWFWKSRCQALSEKRI